MYEALTLNPSASSMTWITPDTSEFIPSRIGLNVTVCPSIFSKGTGNFTVGGLWLTAFNVSVLVSRPALFATWSPDAIRAASEALPALRLPPVLLAHRLPVPRREDLRQERQEYRAQWMIRDDWP